MPSDLKDICWLVKLVAYVKEERDVESATYKSCALSEQNRTYLSFHINQLSTGPQISISPFLIQYMYIHVLK